MGDEAMSNKSIKPRDIQYVLMPVLNDDGGMDPNNPDGWACGDDLEQLEQEAIEYAEEHDGETWIYKVTPVRKIYRGKVRVVKLG